MWMLSQQLQGCYLLLDLFTYLFTYEYKETFRRGLTADSILLIAVDVDLWSNSMDWCWSKSYDLHTSVDRTTPAWEHHCRPEATHEALPHRCLCRRFNREDVESSKYKNKQGGVWCDHWSLCCNVICVCWMALRRPITYWSPTGRRLFGPFRRR